MIRPGYYVVLSVTFGVASVQLAAALVLPPLYDNAAHLLSSTMLIIVCVFLQAFSPLILILRPSKHTDIDSFMMRKILPFVSRIGRPVWLRNWRSILPQELADLQRYSVDVLMGQLGAIVLVTVLLISQLSLLHTLLVLTLVAVGSSSILDFSVGNSGENAAAFIAACLFVFNASSIQPETSQLFSWAMRVTLCFVVVKYIWRLFHLLRTSRFSPLTNSVRNGFDLLWLTIELWCPVCFLTRYIHGGAALVRHLSSTNELWKRTVLRLLQRTHIAIMDVSEMDNTTDGLRWELQSCYSREAKLLLTCHENNWDEVAKKRVREVVPNAVLLPDDFDDLDRLRMLKNGSGRFLPVFLYNDEVSLLRLNQCYNVLIGRVSISDWFNVIHPESKGA